ncbi:hypothetical protein F4604DRAFT_1933092 [Suillus subluteus]|nr:hypothetical protein F4604DRAFT_1933092 [Suillus subluteus]
MIGIKDLEQMCDEEEEQPLRFLTSQYLPLPQVPFITAGTPSTTSSLTPSTLSCNFSPKRQNFFIPTSFIPTSIPSPCKQLSTLPPSTPDPAIHTAPAPITSHMIALPPITQIAQPVTKPTIPFRMPTRGMEMAPTFDGMPACLVPFFEELDLLADDAGLDDPQCIKAALRYTPTNEADTWKITPEAKGQDWAKFMKAIKAMYPGCEGDCHYTRTDLENLRTEQAQQPMHSQEDLRPYYHNFLKISQHLINNNRLVDLECGRFFLEGIHSTTSAVIKRHLEIKLANHHPDDPYSMQEVYNAAVFLLPRTAATALPTQTANAVATLPPQPAAQQPSGGTVVKKEYTQP